MVYEGLLQVANAASSCRRCDLSKHCQGVITGRGTEQAKYMFVLEQPSSYDDYKGELLSGREGQLFDKLLGMCKLKHEDVYVTNAIKCFSFKREGKTRKEVTPKKHSIDACKYWIWEELQHVQPEAVFLMGKLAARSMIKMPTSAKLKDWFGTPISVSYTPAPVVPLYSLSWLLYTDEWHLTKTSKIIRKVIDEQNARSAN